MRIKLGKKTRKELDLLQPYIAIGKKVIRNRRYERVYGEKHIDNRKKPIMGTENAKYIEENQRIIDFYRRKKTGKGKITVNF